MEAEKLSFGNLTLDDLLKFFSISKEDIFDFENRNLLISKEEENFLNSLIINNKEYIEDYSEEELKMLFIAPILNRVSFRCNGVREWLERELSFDFKKVLISGKTDFMLAKGTLRPENPFFFIQEYKKSFPNGNPKWQLLAEMIVAIEKNSEGQVLGSYIFGQYWHFIKLQKRDNRYFFAVSESFDSLKLEELKTIYKNLQAIKGLYCKKDSK